MQRPGSSRRFSGAPGRLFLRPVRAARRGRNAALAALSAGALFAMLSSCGSDDSVPGEGGGARAGNSGATRGGNGGSANSGGAHPLGGSAGSDSGGSGANAGGTGEAGAGLMGGLAGSSSTAGMGGVSPQAGGGSGGAGSPPGVSLSGRQIRVDGAPFHIQGVCWNPVPKGGNHPQDLDFAGAAAQDIPLMRAAGINAVRTYEPLSNRAVLDALHAANIYVLNTVYPYGENAPSSAATLVTSLKDHPAILMWVIGNEWNYNGIYVGLSHAQALARLNEVAAAIRAVDTTHPISTIYGELPSAETIQAMPNIDVWGLNIYRGLSFGDTFSEWAARSDKPFYIAEYGADAWNATLGAEDTQSQAEATRTLTQLIWDNGSAHTNDGTCAGGTIFEWADEWWKDSNGSPSVHDVGGIAPGGGPHPDQTFNEEWWGVVDIDRNPRPAYEELRKIFVR